MEYTMLAFFFLLRLVHLDAWNAAAFVPGRRSVPLSLSLWKPNSSLRFWEAKQQPPVFFRFRRPFLFAWGPSPSSDLTVGHRLFLGEEAKNLQSHLEGTHHPTHFGFRLTSPAPPPVAFRAHVARPAVVFGTRGPVPVPLRPPARPPRQHPPRRVVVLVRSASHLNFRPYNHYSVEDIHQACQRATLQLACHQFKTRRSSSISRSNADNPNSLFPDYRLRLFRPILPVHRKICKTLYSKVFSGERHSHATTAQGAKPNKRREKK